MSEVKSKELENSKNGRGASELTRLLGKQPIMRRQWAMPNSETFNINPIRELVNKYIEASDVSVDPFARNTSYATYRNNLNPDTKAEYNMHAVDFIKRMLEDGVQADLVIFDPPYSPHQTKECYDGFGINMKYEDDARHGWYKTRAAISQLLVNGGICLSFGWDTVGIGKKRGFQIIEILICCHGIGHNDTICTVEAKTQGELFT